MLTIENTLLIIGKAIICYLALTDLNTRSASHVQQPTLCTPFFLNNTKHNKNIVNLCGLFIIGVIFYIMHLTERSGWITLTHGAVYFFVHICCVSVLLPTLYFLRNPKHLLTVLQDHNII